MERVDRVRDLKCPVCGGPIELECEWDTAWAECADYECEFIGDAVDHKPSSLLVNEARESIRRRLARAQEERMGPPN